MVKCSWKNSVTGWPSWNKRINWTIANARKRSLPYHLTVREFLHFSQQSCHYCHSSPVKWRYKESKNIEYIYWNGLDRVDNDRGYTNDNVVPCCFICNSMKSKLSTTEFLRQIERIYKKSIAN